MKTHRIVVLSLGMLLLAGIAAGCGDGDDDGDGTPTGTVASGGGAAPTVNVTLKEFEVAPDTSSVPAGEVTFRATNVGPEDEHELVVIKTDLAPDELPTAEDGSVPEEEVDTIDEIEPFGVGETQEVTVNLEEGSYVLICNVVETVDGVIESHYEFGMRTEFTVE